MRNPQNQTVLAGQDVLLACQVGGDPQPDIHWRRKEADINLNKGNIEVTFAGARDNQSSISYWIFTIRGIGA